LIVDDEPEVAHRLQHALSWEDYGYTQPVVALSAEAALRLLEKEAFDLLITDIRMPGMDGLALLEQVQGNQANLKRLVVSAFDDYEYIRGALRLGVLDYLLKPVDIHELEDIMLKLAKEDTLGDLSSKDESSTVIDDQFREHFLYRWIMGSIAPYEITERLDMARINVTGRRMTVCALRVIKKGGKADEFTSRNLSDALHHVINGKKDAFTFRELEDLYIMVLTDPIETQDQDNPALETMQNLIHRLRLAFNIEVFIGVGRTVIDPQNIRSSYLLARRLVEHSILQAPGVVMDGKDSLLSDTSYRYLSRIDFDALHMMLRNGDEKRASRFILQIMSETGINDGGQALDLNLVMSEILVQTGMMVNRFGAGRSFPVDQWYARYQRVVSAGDFQLWVDAMVSEAAGFLRNTGQHPIIKQMLNIMQESLSDSSLCLKTITSRIPLSATYLGQLFHQETGNLFTSCLADMRIAEAKRLLASSAKRINEIADDLGFNNQSYFNKVFKKHTGQTPAEYRRNSGSFIVPSFSG